MNYRFLCNLLLALLIAGAGQRQASAETSKPLSLTVMSYNILHGTNQAGQDALTSQALIIRKHSPDLVGLQEVDENCKRSGNVDQMKELARITGMHSAFGPHFDYQGGRYGLGLLSRFPLSDVRTDRITLFTKEGNKETRALLSATATLDDGTSLVLATVHMGLNQKSRLVQADEIIQAIAHRGVPVILTGDFNAEPGTDEIRKLEQIFVNAGDPEAHTYPVGEPVKTIDYIMINDFESASRAAEDYQYQVLNQVDLSDHYPIMTTVELGR